MIDPQRASVRPRVICPESGEELPLEEVVRSCLEAGLNRTMQLQGDAASAALALRHLAFVFAGTPEVTIAEWGVPTVTVRGKGGHGLVNYQLVPWSRDDWIEYLLAQHPTRCASVMRRLLHREDADPLGGSPFLWQIVLDLMAADESLATVQETALRYVYSLVSVPALLPKLQAACLGAITLPAKSEAELAGLLTQSPLETMAPLLISHAGLRLLVAADKLAADLAAGVKCNPLSSRLPLELVRAVARLVSRVPKAMAHLKRLVEKKRWAMAASLLHTANTGWIPDPKRLPVLGGAYLRGAVWPDASLIGLVAHGADLAGADLRRADLKEAKLRGANLAGACLQRVLFVRGNADQANLARADLSSLRATGASFDSADLRGADLDGALLAEACLEKALLNNARMTDADLRGARMTGAALAGADLSGSILIGAKLPGVKLRETRCVGAVFAKADLSRCDLEGMQLPAADFTDANLTGALLTGTSIPDGKLDGACLRNAGLAEVDWERASLRDADLTGASFHLGSSRSGRVGSPIACEGSKTGFYTDDYDEQDFKPPEEIRKANLCFVDLRGAIVENVDFYLVDLRGAILDPEQEEYVRRGGTILKARC